MLKISDWVWTDYGAFIVDFNTIGLFPRIYFFFRLFKIRIFGIKSFVVFDKVNFIPRF